MLLQQVQQALQNSGQSLAQAIHNAPGNVSAMLRTQSAILAYNDVFLLTACAAFVLIPTALVMSNIRTKAASGGD